MWSMGSELANLIFLRTAGCRVMITSHQTITATYSDAHSHIALQTVFHFSLFFFSEMASRYEWKVLTYTDCVPLDNPRKLLRVASLL